MSSSEKGDDMPKEVKRSGKIPAPASRYLNRIVRVRLSDWTHEAGHLLAKQLKFLASAVSAGLVSGGGVSVILTSRAGNVRSHIASCAVATLAAHARPRKP